MKKSFQQIMIGTLCTSEEKTLSLLSKLKSMGYDGIELNSFMIHPSGLLVRLLTKMAGMPTGKCGKYNWQELVKKSGLEVSSLHVDLASLENRYEEIIMEAKSFHTHYLVITGMYRFNYQDQEALQSLCDRLNMVGEKVAQAGLSLLYHNHNVEYQKVSQNTTAFQYILEHTQPDFVGFEYDSYWPSESGVDVVSQMEQLKTRLKLHHINDRGNRQNGPYMTPILKSDCLELGSGNMPLDKLIAIDKSADIEYIIVETHKNFVNNSPIQSLEKSLTYLKEKI